MKHENVCDLSHLWGKCTWATHASNRVKFAVFTECTPDKHSGVVKDICAAKKNANPHDFEGSEE